MICDLAVLCVITSKLDACLCLSPPTEGGGGKSVTSDSSAPQQASPLRPRRFTLGPTRGGGRKRDHDGLSVHLQWPVCVDSKKRECGVKNTFVIELQINFEPRYWAMYVCV